MGRIEDFFFRHFALFALLGICLFCLLFWWMYKEELREEKAYREDCLREGGKMIGETCFMPGYGAVERPDDGDTTIIMTN
jgi:hypothetical protein